LQQGGVQESMRWGPMLQLGLYEQQNRATRRSNEKAEQIAASGVQIADKAVKIAKVTLWVAIVSLVFTSVAGYYAWQATRSSDRGEARQFEQLEALRREATRQVEQLDALRGEAVATRASIDQLHALMATVRGNTAAKPRR